eukprot:scaffold280_cov353-Prasinococcus_capsulatus_cf.AAC.3
MGHEQAQPSAAAEQQREGAASGDEAARQHQGFRVDPSPAAAPWKTCTSSLQPTPNNFVRGALWSPDGACLLAHADDNCYRLFDMCVRGRDVPGLLLVCAASLHAPCADAGRCRERTAPKSKAFWTVR